MSNGIPSNWTPLWWARHRPTGDGATHFFRRVRQGGKVVAESEGWRKNGKEIERC